MLVSLRRRRVTLDLPIVPRRYVKGDARNRRRWHAWVDAVTQLSAWFKGPDPRGDHGRRRRA